jgi:urea transport system ATP-binding protein
VASPLLDIQDVHVTFDGFRALDGVSLQIFPNTARVIIGPNGAGKSTLLDTVIGRTRATRGRVVFRGDDITRLPEHRIVRAGICRKFQTPGVLEQMTVDENLAIAVRKHKQWWAHFRFGLDVDERVRVNAVLAEIDMTRQRDRLAAELAHGEKQWLEIGMVLASDAELILLDEPTSGMTPAETDRTAALIHRLAQRHTVVVIDHDMAFVEKLAAPVTVLHQGRVLKEGDIQTLRDDPEVISIYLGRAKKQAKDENSAAS